MIDEFLETMRLNRSKSPWMQERTFNEMVDELEKEVHELRAENDPTRVRDELGDVLMDVLSLVAIAEDHGWFSAEELVNGADAKFRRRKPWIFEEHNLTAQEEMMRWKKAKEKE